MTTLSNMERMNLSNSKALRRAREQLNITNVKLARRLEVSAKTIDRLENAEAPLNQAKINEVMSALGISIEEFLKAKRGRSLFHLKKREKLVVQNSQRRSYQKHITKEVQVLRSMWKLKGISQDQDRIRHIVSSPGLEMGEFRRLMGALSNFGGP